MSVTSLLRGALIAGIFLVPAIPFIVAELFLFPFITGKNFTFRILTELLFGLWLLYILREPSARPRFSWFYPIIGFLLVGLAISTVFSVEPYKSFWSNFERMEGYVTLIHLALYFTVVASVMTTTTLWKRFFEVTTGASALVGAIALLQLGGVLEIHQGGVRLDATFGNATYLAVYMLIHVFIALILFVRNFHNTFVRYALPLVILLQIVVIYYTATRGTILGLLGGLLVAAIAIAVFERENRALRRGAVGVLIALGVIVLGFFAIRNTSFVQESEVLSRFASISLEERTTKSRFLVYEMAWKGFTESGKTALIGWGPESFNYVFNKYYDPGMYAQEQWFDRAHNQFLEWLVAGGILGFLGYIALYIVALLMLLRAGGKISVAERSLLLGLLAGYAFHNLFVFDNIVSSIYFFTILAYLHYLGRRETPGLMFLSRIDEKVQMRLLMPGIALVTLGAMWFFNTPHLSSAYGLLEALKPQPQGAAQNLTLFKEVITRKDMGRQEGVEQLVTSALTVARTQNVPLALKAEFVDAATQELDALIADHPENTRLHVFKTELLLGLDRRDEALAAVKKALELSPNKQQIIFSEGLIELRRGNYTRALVVMKQAFDLEPHFDQARILYALAAVYAKNIPLATEILTPRYGTHLVEDDRLAGAYFENGYFDFVIAIRRKTLERDQSALQPRLQVAGALLAKGDRAGAIAELEEAIRRNPSFKEQGEYFINEIKAGRNP